MDLLGLPTNVQRRIALLVEQRIDQATDRSSGVAASQSQTSDHGCVGAAVSTRAAAVTACPVEPWKLPVTAENVAAVLQRAAAGAIYSNVFGHRKLQVRSPYQLLAVFV